MALWRRQCVEQEPCILFPFWPLLEDERGAKGSKTSKHTNGWKPFRRGRKGWRITLGPFSTLKKNSLLREMEEWEKDEEKVTAKVISCALISCFLMCLTKIISVCHLFIPEEPAAVFSVWSKWFFTSTLGKESSGNRRWVSYKRVFTMLPPPFYLLTAFYYYSSINEVCSWLSL